MYRDKYGLIVQKDGDDGDSLHRMGVFLIGEILARRDLAASKAMLDMISHLSSIDEHGRITWIRGATQWTNPNDVSRDQLIPVIIGLGLFEREAGLPSHVLDKTVSMIEENKLRAPNGDLFIGHYSLIVRATWQRYDYLQKALSWAFLLITDVPLVLGSVVKCLPFRWNEQKREIERNGMDQVDDWNDLLPLLQAMILAPTPLTWLARKIYSNFRGENHGHLISAHVGPENDVFNALLWYNRLTSGGNPELVDPFVSAISFHFRTNQWIKRVKSMVRFW
jgi:hypothetical protein